MTLYDITKKYGEGKGDSMMWSTLTIVSDAIENSMTDCEKKRLIRSVYAELSGKHYNEEFAREDVSKMFFVDKNGTKHHAPYWGDEAIEEIYEQNSNMIPEYGFWDFYVVMQMMKADNCPLLQTWFPNSSTDEMDKRIVEMAVNWLRDEDNPYGDHKIWCYLNPGR